MNTPDGVSHTQAGNDTGPRPSSDMLDPQCRVVVGTTLNDIPVIAIAGEADLEAMPALRRAVDTIGGRIDAAGIVVSLSETAFCDSHCLGWLIGLRERVGPDRIWLVAPSAAVLVVLRLTRTLDAFQVIEDLSGVRS